MKFAIFRLCASVDTRSLPGAWAPRCHPRGPGSKKHAQFFQFMKQLRN